MSPVVKSSLLVLGAAVAISAAWYTYWTHRPGPGPGPVPAQMSFDQFQAAMQQAVFTRYGGSANGSDFSVMVATPDADVGELIRAAGSLPVDQSDCAPNPAPTPLSFDGVFPAYTLSNDAAVTADLGGQAADALAHLNASVKSSSAVQFRVDNAKIRLLADNRIDQITGAGACHDYISTHSGVRLVRGVVTGRVTYSVALDHPADVKADLTKSFGSIDVEQDPANTTVNIASTDEVPLVSMLSVFEVKAAPPPAPVPVGAAPGAAPAAPTHLAQSHEAFHPGQAAQPQGPAHAGPPAGGGAPAAPPAAQPAVQLTIHPSTAPTTLPNGPRLYVQADSNESPTDTAAFVAFLQQAWPQVSVVPQVETVPSAKMPLVAQVRFFNAGDEPLARQGLGILRQKYPNARIIRIGLSAPAGQLEVWLPRQQ